MRAVTLGLLVGLIGCSDGKGNDEDGDGVEAPLDCDDNNKDVKPGGNEVCDGIDNDCDGSIDEGMGELQYPDVDGDGYGALGGGELSCDELEGYINVGGDCDDGDGAVHPDADEDCSDIDMNCDGDPLQDAVAPTWYVDSDNDAYGQADITLTQCDQPPGYVANDQDCNDGDPTVAPGQVEVCDGVDNDCNLVIDDNATDAVTVYADTDLDGYGDDGSSQLACPGFGQVELGGDCDDANDGIYPGAEEICDGGIDNDCDPATDENVLSGISYYADLDNDGYGLTGSSVFGCEQPPYSSTVDGDCDDTDPDSYPGGQEVCGGGDEDCDGTVDNNAADGISYYNDGDGDLYGDVNTPVVSCAVVPGLILTGGDCNDADPAINPDTVWYTDNDSDLHGDPLLPVVSCLQPVNASALDDDCDDTDPTSFPGNIEICDGGIDNDCDPDTDEALTATWYFDGDGDGYGIESNTANGCAPPPSYVQEAGDCDDTDPDLNPTLTPDCIQDHCGTIALSETWKNTVEHTVSCDVAVQGAAGPTLTIQDGSVVRFDDGYALEIGRTSDGRLFVPGGGVGVVMTSNQPFPIPGDWDGLLLGANDQGSDLTGLTVEYGMGITIDGGDPVLDTVTSQYNLGDGIRVGGSEPLIVSSMLVSNTNNGLYVEEGAGLSRFDALGTLDSSFQNNVLTDNGDRPVTVPGSHADEIDLTNVVSPNTIEEIELLDGVLRFTGTWFDHGIPYVVAQGVLIEVQDGPQAQLTIEDGVDVYFNVDAELRIGDDAEGYLEIESVPVAQTQGVLFSATQTVIALSDNWNGVKFGSEDAGSQIRNLTVEYGGGNTKGNIWVDNSAPTFSNLWSQYSDTSGMFVGGSLAAPEIADSTLVDNDEHGVWVDSTSGIARSLLGPTFAGNTLTGNGQSPVVMPPNFLGELDPSTTFSGNGNRIGVHGGNVLGDALWRLLDEDYQVRGTINVDGPQDPELTIEDGVSMYFDRDTAMEVGTTDDGALLINGVVGVTFTSSDTTPGEGDWYGLRIGDNGPLRSQTTITGLSVAYAGGSDTGSAGGAIEVQNRGCNEPVPSLVQLTDLTVTASSKYSIFAENHTSTSWFGATNSGSLEGCAYFVGPAGTCFAPDIQRFEDMDCLDGAVFGTFPLADVDMLQDGNTFPGPVVIEDSFLATSVTLPTLPVAYIFTEEVDVDGVGSPVLTIAADNTLLFTNGAGLAIGDGNDPGGLSVASGVTLTAFQAVPTQGDWLGVTVGKSCTTVDLAGLAASPITIEYGGANGDANLFIDACDLGGGGLIDEVHLSDSSTCGLFYDALDSNVSIQDVTYNNNLIANVCP